MMKKIKFGKTETNSEYFFEDSTRHIDYVLVYNTQKSDYRRDIFIENIRLQGLEMEDIGSIVYSDIHFIKIYAPHKILDEYAEKFNIPIKFKQTTFLPTAIPRFKFLRTELTEIDPKSPNFHRAIRAMSHEKPQTFLTSERSLIVFNILKRLPFDSNQFGILRLVREEVFIAAYPMHDGGVKWNNDPNIMLNDRQLLARYWSDLKMLFKAQPLDLIEQYFGDNVAIYFAWLSFYNRMLIWPVIMGLIVFITGWSTLGQHYIPIEEACHSNLTLCPTCKDCQLRDLKDSCMNYKLAYVYDNKATVIYAVAMSLWAIIYMMFWKRKEEVLVVRWNILFSKMEKQDARPEFENFASKYIRTSELDEPEHYIPVIKRTWRLAASISIVLFTIFLVIGTMIAILLFDITISSQINNGLISTVISSTLFSITITILRRLYQCIVAWLTELEIPKTQTDFDNSYILKVFAFSFVNNYGGLIYLAFFKGYFYTYPGDINMYNSSFAIVTNICDPSGCISDVHITLQFYMILLPIFGYISDIFISSIIIRANRRKEKKANLKHDNLPRWERDFHLNEINDGELILLYEEMVVQFGFVTVFAFAFPISPILAFLNNLIKITLDSHKLVRQCRRPQAKRTASIGAWLDIIKFLIYLSVFTNACYISFTSDVITKLYYQFMYNHTLEGFVRFTLSKYEIDKSIWSNLKVPNGTLCWYPSQRNRPDHRLPYNLSYEYYILLSIKLAFVIVFEHVVLAITSLISYCISDTPECVQKKHAVDAIRLRRVLSKVRSSDSNLMAFSSQHVLKFK